jgi:hypothetical protein
MFSVNSTSLERFCDRPQKFVEKVEGLGRHEVLVLAVHEALPPLPRMPAQNVGEPRVQLDLEPMLRFLNSFAKKSGEKLEPLNSKYCQFMQKNRS